MASSELVEEKSAASKLVGDFVGGETPRPAKPPAARKGDGVLDTATRVAKRTERLSDEIFGGPSCRAQY